MEGSSLLPAKMWDSLRSEVEGLFDRFSPTFEGPEFRPLAYFWPRKTEGFANLVVDVAKTDKAYVIAAELPGIDEKDVDVEVSDDAVIIKGEKVSAFEKESDYYLSERTYGAFERIFALPKDVDRRNITAKYVHGLLTVTIPRIAKAENLHRIHVKAA
jgi:HSP20 family protein